MVFGVQVMRFGSVLVHYVDFVFVEYVSFECSSSDPVILENVLKICVIPLAQK